MVYDLTRGDYVDVSEIAARFFHVLSDLDKRWADAFGLEVLRWAVCCGDIHRAIIYTRAFTGVLRPSTTVVIGLFARDLWILSDALSHVQTSEDISLFIEYFAAVHNVMRGITAAHAEAGMLEADSALFWMAAESIRCNSANFAPIFESAMEVILLHLRSPILFAGITRPFARGQFTPRVFWKFHQPWRDSFPGLARPICEYRGLNISLCIRALNLIVQSQFPPLFGPRENWLYTSLLLLLPWMLYIVLTDLSRFVFTSADAHLIEGTLPILKVALPEPEIQAGLDAIRNGNATALYETAIPLCTVALAKIVSEDFELIGHLYAAMLRNAGGRRRLSLYVAASWIISPSCAHAFAEFAALVDGDSHPQRAPLREAILTRLAGAPEHLEILPNGFPFLRLMERIVVVDVPHLYEVDALNERTSLCEDLNSFVPMAPTDPRLAGNERVTIIRETLETVDLPPFREWERVKADGEAFMGGVGHTTVDLERIEEVRIDVPEVVHDDDAEEDGEFGVEGDGGDEGWQMGFVILGPEPFIPSMEAVNATGVEYFEQILGSEEGDT
jgi:hypothetical protein